MTTEAKLAALFARSSTPALVTSLLTLDAAKSSPERNWARAKTIGELERRFPEAAAAVEQAFDAAETDIEQGGTGDVDYVAVLVAAIPLDQF